MPGSYTASHTESHVRALHPRHNRSSHTSSAQPRAHASTPGKASHASMAPQRPLPTANGHFQRPTATSNGQRSLPVAISNSQRPLPMANAHFQRPLPMVNGHFQRSTATSNGRFQRPTAASNGHFQRPSASRTPGQAVRAVAAAVAVWLCRSCVAVSCRLSRPRGPEPQRPLAGSRRLCPGGRQKVKGFQ